MDRLIYHQSAKQWKDALPMGNGYLGAMVYGKIKKEFIYMNEDSLVSRGPMERMNPLAKEHLGEVRELLLAEKTQEAQKLIPRYFFSVSPQSPHYEPLGQVCVEFDHADNSDYTRILDLQTAMTTVDYQANETSYHREYYISYPQNVMVCHFAAQGKKKLNLDLYLMRRDGGFGKSDSFVDTIDCEEKRIFLSGYNGNQTDGLSFTMAIAAETKGGTITKCGGRLAIDDASEVTIYVVGRTSYRSENPKEWCAAQLDNACKIGHAKLLEEHLADYQKYYNRMSLKLKGDPAVMEQSIPERLERTRAEEKDADLLETFVNFGRYLTIVSSREGSLPGNLQGIWNNDFTPYWGARYTININTQMNYWLAEKVGLPEMHMSLMNLMKTMLPRGEKIAKEFYGCRGTCAHHNTDVWGDCAVTDYYDPSSVWPFGFVWLSLHIWEHYQYTRDKAFLEEYFQMLKENAEFLVDYLFEDKDGTLHTGPSVSPENTFITENGDEGTFCYSPEMDIQMVREFFVSYLQALDEMKSDYLREDVVNCLSRLPKTKIGKYGQIMEWQKDYEEIELGHRHISQLFGLYPGYQIRYDETPELCEAAAKTIERRVSHGGGQGGWCSAWIVGWYARVHRPQEAETALMRLFKEYASESLLESFNNVFQVDGNFAGPAAILECLVQDYDNKVFILPAVMSQLAEGELKGLRLRAGASLDMKWHDGKLDQLCITADYPLQLQLVMPDRSVDLSLNSGEKFNI